MPEHSRLIDSSARFQTFLTDIIARNEAGNLTFGWDPANPEAENCLTFAGQAMEALFGVNPYTEMGLDLAYDSPDSALQALKSKGYDSVEELLSTIFEPVGRLYVQQGDIVLIRAQFMPGNIRLSPSEEAQQAFRFAVAVADPPWFWVISSTKNLAKGMLSATAPRAFSTHKMNIPNPA